MEDNYLQKEEIGRVKMDSLFKDIFSNYKANITYTEYRYAPNDARIDFYDNNGNIFKTIIVEIKVRDTYSHKESLMLEYDKYRDLMTEKMFVTRDENIKDVKIWYVNFIADEAYIFSLKDNEETFEIYCRRNNFTIEKVKKKVIFLNKIDAKLYKYKK